MVEVTTKGNFRKTEKLLVKLKEPGIKQRGILSILKKYGEQGCMALRDATPKDTGLTASSWEYVVRGSKSSYSIIWINKNDSPRDPDIHIAYILRYGHGKRGGGYVKGQDYISPAIKPIFDEIINKVWEEVTKVE